MWLKNNIEVILFYVVGGFLGFIASLFLFLTESSFESNKEIYDWIKTEPPVHVAMMAAICIIAGICFVLVIRSRKIIKDQKYKIRILEEISKNKTEFVSSVTHFIRTPISALKFSVSMFLEGEFDNDKAKQKEVLGNIYSRIQRLVALTRDLLEVSKLEEGRTEIVKEKISLSDLSQKIESVIKDMMPLAREKNIGIVYLHTIDNNKTVEVDCDKIEQIVDNFLDNALTYSNMGTTVKVSLTNSEKEVVCSVNDAGIGIPSFVQEKVFGRFFRADNAVNFFSAGMGIGLYLCKEAVNVHHGNIWFKSEEGKGSTFYFSIPLIVEKPREFFEKI